MHVDATAQCQGAGTLRQAASPSTALAPSRTYRLDAAGRANNNVRRLRLQQRLLLLQIHAAVDDHHVQVGHIAAEALKLMRDLDVARMR